MLKPPLFLTLLLLCIANLYAQNNNEELFNNFSSHNFLKHNRFFLNPTFSVARENKTSLSFLSRNQFSDFDDSPQLYVGSYSGRINEKVGIGLGVFQQNFGIFKNFGVLVNYAYQVQLSEQNALSFGFNFMYARSGIDRNKIQVTNPDPFLANFQERPIINFQPAVNVTLGNLDFGIFLENLIDYDLKQYEFITTFSDKTFSGHVMYTKPFESASGIFENTKLQLLNIVRKPGKNSVAYTGSLLLDFPKFGWVQSTYDDFYGTSLGIGFNISERISIGFVYENGNNNLGFTNEISLTYNFGKQDYVKLEETKMLDFDALNTTSTNTLDKNTEDLPEKELITETINLYKIQQDSISAAEKRESDRKYLQLLKLIKSNQQNMSVEIVSNKKKDSVIKTNFIPKKKQAVIKTPSKKQDGVVKETNIKSSKYSISAENLNGYFVVANYFSKESNAKSFSKTMENKGFTPHYFKHPSKNYYYVYLNEFNTNITAQKAVASKLNNTYTKLLSIVKVSNNKVINIPIQKNLKENEKSQEKAKVKSFVKIKKLKSSEGLAPGYYLVVNVFSKKYYANKFLKNLTEQGLNPQFFIYSKNNYRYVYLAKRSTKKEILELYYSNVKGRYTNDKWIMHIE